MSSPVPVPWRQAPARWLPWPLPALAAWLASWMVFVGLHEVQAPWLAAFGCAALTGAALAWLGPTPWRRACIGLGFPASWLAIGLMTALPGWAWLVPLAALAGVYPLRAWRDAPMFPTPRGALTGLERLVPLPEGAAILDAGCGLGDGLAELRRAYPQARLHGLEWSWPLSLAARWRRPDARIRRGDIWRADWSGYAMVYLFQRPESMARAHAKACREQAAGAWLASLEFAVPEVTPSAVLECADGRRLWLYRVS